MDSSWTQQPPVYSYHPPVPSPSEDIQTHQGGITIVLRCPRLSSLQFFLSTYLTVMASIGWIFSLFWVISHAYVLSHTSDYSLREQRYVDVCVGLCLLVAQTCLMYGVYIKKLQHILGFLILTCLVIVAYWSWWVCLYYTRQEMEASKELWDTLTILTLVYLLFLIAPTIPFYKNLEDNIHSSSSDHASDKSQHPPYTICQ